MTSSGKLHQRDEQVRRKVLENPRRREDSGREKVDPESLLNCRFRGTTLPCEELLDALEDIIIDKVTTHSVSKVKKIDTRAPVEIGMAAGTEDEEAFEEGCGKTSEFAVQAVYKGTGAKGGWNVKKGANRNGK